ncbi:hypothetical protein RU94_GL000765 [Enterococcus asini]|nr:hypothetical protein RU94_GL000765 [Enterococcus asini]
MGAVISTFCFASCKVANFSHVIRFLLCSDVGAQISLIPKEFTTIPETLQADFP